MKDQGPWRWALPGLLVLNLVLKFSALGLNELGGDEPFTVYWAQRPLMELFGMLRTENNPPLYFLLMHGWSTLVPLETAWLRVPSAFFSILTVWPLFLIGKRLSGPLAGLVVGLLFTFSNHSYAFAHEVRAYSLLALACTWAVWQLLNLSDGGGTILSRISRLRGGTILWLAAANILAVWTHYFGWLMVGTELVLVFGVPQLRRVRVKMLAAAAITVLLSLPWAGVVLARAGESLGHGTWVDAPTWEEPYNMVMRWSNAPVVAVLFLVLIAWALVRGKERKWATPLLWCGLPLIGLFAISFVFPVYVDRYLYFASPAFYLLVGMAAVERFHPRQPAWLLPAGVVIAMAATFTPWKGNGLHPSAVVSRVEAWRDGNTAVVIQPAWYDLNYAWQLDNTLFKGAVPVEIALRERKIFPVAAAEMPELDSTVVTVVHIDAWASLTDPGHAVLNGLRARFIQTDSVEADKKVMLRRFQLR
ncbi:MAG: hypothetical protein WAT41_14160 [Flavobacteriales bacterium]